MPVSHTIIRGSKEGEPVTAKVQMKQIRDKRFALVERALQLIDRKYDSLDWSTLKAFVEKEHLVIQVQPNG